MPNITQLDKLKGILLRSDLQQTNQPLWQVINQLIDYLKASNIDLNQQISGGGGGGGGGGLANQTYLTHTNASADLPNSRQLLAGTGITFDDSVANERTINASAADFVEWSVLTNGDPINPELIFADGDVIMTHTP